MSNSPAPILEIEHVSCQYDRATFPAVQQVSLTLQQGDLLALLGPSGCGKTTLLRLIAGFERPHTGRIMLAAQLVAGEGYWLPPEQRRVGMVFQDFALFPHLTVARNVAFGLQRGHTSIDLPPGQIQERVRQTIDLVGLAGFQDRYPHQLSGGQQQRVALARALAPQPAIILLDEPLSNLDAQVRLRLRQEVRDILKRTGISGVFVTHDQEEALSIADWVAVMHQGQIEQWGTPEQVYHQPASRFVAEFVTQANFLPGQRQGQTWQTELGRLGRVQEVDAAMETGDVMLRQEDLVLQPQEEGRIIVCDRQFLGREYRYRLKTPSGRALYARTSSQVCLPVGSRVDVALADKGAIVFASHH